MRKLMLVAALAAVAAFVAPASAQNLLVNGDFATNDLTGWTPWQSTWGGPFTRDASSGSLQLQCNGGSFGVGQSITTVPGQQYTISLGTYQGAGASNWVELLFCNDDGRSLLDQMDAPHPSSIILKVDGWGMNGGMPFSSSLTDPPAADTKWFPSGLHTATITATGTSMIVGLKTGANGGSTAALFDNVVVTPEPVTLALLGIPALALIRRRRSA